ncbi:YggT family protein [Pendulispora albinea]|uniref:YggT family protein n=1 Tax=Pendulispora albinea TaxID=2741071 RepID=A0ABZ2LUG4_9BACT
MIWVRLIQLINLAFFCVYTLLFIRFGLEYIRANEQVGFVRFIKQYTEPLYRPFRGLLPVMSDPGGHPLVVSILAAMAAVAIVHLILRSLLRAISRPALIED